jgi:magnesium transporter
MKKIGMDPASPELKHYSNHRILTTVTDVMEFLAFLGFAVVFQEHLV